MKNKKKVLSILMSIFLISSCNKKIVNSSNCPVTDSTPSVPTTPVDPIPDEPKKINIFDYAKTAINADDTISLISFEGLSKNEKLSVEEVIFPETINGKTFTTIFNQIKGGIFNGFDNLKRIYIPKTVITISSSTNAERSPFINLPSLENIIVDSENKYFKVIEGSNCLINSTNDFNTANVICGWKNVTIPDNVSSLSAYNFSYNESITSITLNSNVTIVPNSFTYLNNLKSMNLNGNSKYKLEQDEKGGVLYLPNNSTAGNIIYAAYGDITYPSEIKAIHNSNHFLRYFYSVTSIHLPTGFILADKKAFQDLPNLKNITVDSSITKYIIPEGSNCLIDTSTTVTGSPIIAAWGDVKVPNTVANVDLTSFTSVTSCILHDKVTKIGKFNYTKIKSLYIPDSVAAFESDAFYYMNNLEEIKTGTRLSDYLKAENGCIYNPQNPETRYGYYGDVKLPANINIKGGMFSKSTSIKSIYIPKEITELTNDFLSGVNDNKKIGQYVDIIIDEENPKFKVKVKNNSKCIVELPDTVNETIRFAFPNEEGEICFPDTAKKFNCELDCCVNPQTITSLNMNEGFEDYHITNGGRNMESFINITKIELPSTIKTLDIQGSEFIPFWGMKYLEYISINGGENNYFKIEGNCLISKQNRFNQDVILLGWGHVEIPQYMTSLPRQYALAYNNSILSLKIHNKITSVWDSTFYYASNRLDHIEFVGTVDDLRTPITELNQNKTTTLLALLKAVYGGYSNYYIYYLDNNGNQITNMKVSYFS